MCYSGKCRWEGYMGNCNFPWNKKVREKYQFPVCEIPESKEEQEELNAIYEDIRNILKEDEKNH